MAGRDPDQSVSGTGGPDTSMGESCADYIH